MKGRLLLYLILSLVPLTSLAIYLAYDDGREEQSRARSEHAAAARLAGAELDGVFRLSRSLVSGLSQTASDSSVCGSLPTWKRSFPEFINVGIFEIDIPGGTGREICSAVPLHVQNFAITPAESRVALTLSSPGKVVVSPIRWNRGEPSIPISARMSVGSNGTLRIVTAVVGMNWLNRQLIRIPIPAGSELLVLDSGGFVAASSPLSRRIPLGSAAPEFEKGLLARADFDGETGSFYVLKQTRPADGLTTILKIPASEIFRRSRTRFAYQLGGLLSVTAFVFSLAWTSSHRFLIHPLARLRDVADRLARGHLAERTQLEYSGDIGSVARSFDVMAETLQREKLASARMLGSLRALTARLDRVGEEERTRIAREIHDELGQQLTAIRFELDPIARQDGSFTSARAQDAIALVDAAFQEVRRIATELRPAALEYGSLGDSIAYLVSEFQRRTSIRCAAILPPEREADAAGPTATCLFRICQESLTNIGRHAAATAVEVVLDRDSEAVTLTVRDNGRGFRPADFEQSPSLGLLGMRERARIAGGTLEIISAPGEGTSIVARIPLATLALAAKP